MTRSAAIFLWIASSLAIAQTSTITVVDGASYKPTLAPDGIATIFGSGMAHATASATLDANGQLPTELANTRVVINGNSASLIYVSPTQINFIVPSGVVAGAGNLSVRATDSPLTITAPITVAAAAPALFSSDASGTGPGAILNAVTFVAAPFLVDTPENGGDNRTRLALYGTGLRHASSVTARANQTDLTVEYAGAAPGFFGLDQVNVVLPASLDGAGAVSITVSTDNGATSNVVTALINQLPAARLQLASLSLNPTYVLAGDSMTATATLNGVARTGGATMSLGSTAMAAQPPATLSIPEGSASAQAAIPTIATNTTQTGRIVAILNGISRSADFQVDPASTALLNGFTLSASSLLGGRNLTGTVTLSSPAPSGGLNIQIASDNSAVQVPAVVLVPFNQTSATFNISTTTVTAATDVNLTTTLSRNSITAKLKLLTAISFTVNSTSVVGGTDITATVTLGDAAPAGGAIVLLSSTNSTIVKLPFTQLNIPQGSNSTTFTISTMVVTGSITATVTANYQGQSQSVTITVTPPAPLTLSNFTIGPSTVTGGTTAQGTVTLSGPAGLGGQRVTISSSLPLIANYAAGVVTVPEGNTSAIFTITTSRPIGSQTVTFTATMNGVSKTATLTVQ